MQCYTFAFQALTCVRYIRAIIQHGRWFVQLLQIGVIIPRGFGSSHVTLTHLDSSNIQKKRKLNSTFVYIRNACVSLQRAVNMRECVRTLQTTPKEVPHIARVI